MHELSQASLLEFCSTPLLLSRFPRRTCGLIICSKPRKVGQSLGRFDSTVKLGVRPRTASAVYRLFPVLSKCLAIPSLTLEIELAFQPLLVDLSVRWLDLGEDMIGKLEASAMLIALHNELYP